MDVGGTTWIVAADGARARIFEERRRCAEVRELPDLAIQAGEDDRPRSHRHLATVHDRNGAGRHGGGERQLAEETARRFLKRLSEALEEAARAGRFDTLVLMAPPRALGVLRAQLSPALLARVTATDPHDTLREEADEIRERLRAVRAKSWRR